MYGDPGLQAQRTALAWVRTALGAAGAGGLMVKVGVDAGSSAIVLAGGLALLCGAVLGLLSRRRRAVLAAAQLTPRHVAAERELTVVGALVTATALTVVLSLLVTRAG